MIGVWEPGCKMFFGEETPETHQHNLYCDYFAEALEEERIDRLLHGSTAADYDSGSPDKKASK